MTKITFENLPSTNTPVNATNLNQLQTNVENGINTGANITTGTDSNVQINSTYVDSIANCTYAKSGKVVQYNIHLILKEISSAINYQNLLSNLKFKPLSIINAYFQVSNSAQFITTTPAWAQVDSSGNLYLKTPSAISNNSRIQFTLIYLTNDT